MKKQISIIGAMAALLFLVSCDGTKKATSNNNEVSTLWVNSTLHEDVVIHEEVGVKSYSGCFAASHAEKLDKDEMGFVRTKWKPMCGKIKGFNFEQGHIYHLKVKKISTDKMAEKDGIDMGEWELVEVLSKEKDIHYQQREAKTVWIGAEKNQGPLWQPHGTA